MNKLDFSKVKIVVARLLLVLILLESCKGLNSSSQINSAPIERLTDIIKLRGFFYKGFLEITSKNYESLILAAKQNEVPFKNYEGGIFIKDTNLFKETSSLMELLLNFSKVRKFKINAEETNEVQAEEVIVEIIPQYTELIELDLSGCNLNQIFMQHIFESISNPKKIQVLHVSGDRLSEQMLENLREKFLKVEIVSAAKNVRALTPSTSLASKIKENKVPATTNILVESDNKVSELDSSKKYKRGLMYENGWGVESNYTEARKYYKEAIQQGHQDAQSKLDELDILELPNGKVILSRLKQTGETLELDYCELNTEEHINVLFKYYLFKDRLAKVHTVDLKGNGMDGTVATRFIEQLEGTDVQRVDLGFNELNSFDAVLVAQKLHGSSVRTLVLEKNQIDDVSLLEFAENLQKTQVKTVVLTDNSISDKKRRALQSQYPNIYWEFRIKTGISNGGKLDSATPITPIHSEIKKIDLIQALEKLESQAQQGDAVAQNMLGSVYASGKIVPKNYQTAFDWFQKAAIQDNSDAKNNLGLLYANCDIIKNDKKAFGWFQEAAHQSHADARNNLALMYKDGRGVAKNNKKAFELFQQATLQGHKDAQFNLGIMYKNGWGVEEDYKKALTLFQQAGIYKDVVIKNNIGDASKDSITLENSYKEIAENKEKVPKLKMSSHNMTNIRRGFKNESWFQEFLLAFLPNGYTLGAAYDNGDCFFDALAQWLNKKNNTDINTVKYLRMVCYDFYKKNKDLTDSWNQKDCKGIYKKLIDYNKIQYTAEECDQLLNGRSPIWGRQNVEGKILCKELELQGICVIEVLQDPETGEPVLSYHLVDAQNYKPSINEKVACTLIKQTDIPILVTVQGDLHFVPLWKEGENLADVDKLLIEEQSLSDKSQITSENLSFRQRSRVYKGKEKEKEDEKENLIKWEVEELLAYAQSANREAQFLLAEQFYESWQQHYKEEDLQEAKKWLEKAADQGHEVAIALLAEVNLPPLVEKSKTVNPTGKGKEKEFIFNTSPTLSIKSSFRKQGQVSLPLLYKKVEEDSQQQELKNRIIDQLARPAYYQRIKLELHKYLLSSILSQEQKERLSQLIRTIIAPEKKLSLGASYEIREDFSAKPSQEHNLFEPLRRDLQKLAGCKQEFADTPIESLLEELIEKHQAFIASLTEEVKKLGPTAPLKLFEAKPFVQGESFDCHEVTTKKAYQLACYNLHEYEYVRSNASGLSIGSMHGGVYFKVDNGTGLLRPAKEHAVYSLYQALGIADLLSPTHLIIMNGLSILPPDIGESPERRELSQKKQELQTPSTQEVFNHYPELEQKLKVVQKERSLFIQGSLVVPGNTLEKFLEEAEKSPSTDLVIQQLEPVSFSGHVLASLLLLPTDYKADNLMVDEQNRIVGIDNDAALEANELRRLNSSNKHAVSIKNILYLLPLMQSAIATTIQRQFAELHPALFLLNWLIGLREKQPHYDYLLSSSLIDVQHTAQIKKNAEQSLGLPLQFVPGWIAAMYERFTKIQIALKNNPSITHQELFEQIHSFASRYYNAVRKLFSHPLDQIAFIYEKTPKAFDISISNTLEDLVAQYPEKGDERLLNNFAGSSFIKQDPSLSIEQAIQELIASIDLKKYDASQQLSYIKRVIDVDIWPATLHESWHDPELLIRMVAEGASNKVIKILIKKVKADVHARNEVGETVLHAAVRRGGEDALRQIPLLIQLKADIEAQNEYGITPLDLAAEKEDIDLFKHLIDLGAGEKAINKRLNNFYKKLNVQEKEALAPYITKLTQVNPKAGWKISLDEIFPKQGEGKVLLKTITEGDRIISEEAWDRLFEKDGKPKKTNSYGIRSVPFVEKHGQRIYVKFFPQLPGTELAVIRLAESLLGYCAPYCELAFINNIPILLTQDVPGDTIYEVLNNHPEKLNQLDPESVSKALILAMLINPGDGNLGNYILSPFTNSEGQERYRLISIDNDQAFMPAIAKSIKTGLWGATLSLQVKTILYCLEAIKQPVSQAVVNKIKSAELLKVLESWLSSLKIYHELARNHFDSTLLKKYQKDKTTVIGVAFTPGMIKQLFTKLMRLQTGLNKKKTPTHFDLLEALEPFVAHRYRAVIMDSRLNSIEKFKRVENITEEQALTSSSNALSQLLISREIPEIDKLQAALWSGNYGPNQGLKELQEVRGEHIKLEQILKDLGRLDIKTLRQSTTGITEKLLREAELTKLSLLQQKALLDVIKGQELTYLHLKNCNALKGSLLVYFKLDRIKKLDVSGCSNLGSISSGIFGGSPLIMPTLTHFRLDESGISSIRLQAPELKKLSVRNCPKLEYINLIAPKLHRLDLREAIGLPEKVIRSLFEKFPNTFIYLTPTPAFPQEICANYLKEEGLARLDSNHQYELAAHYLKQSAEQGNPSPYLDLPKLALKGSKIAQGWVIEQAEKEGSTVGEILYKFGNMYELGIGVQKDKKTAVKCYIKAAKQGNDQALSKVIILTLRGVKLAQQWVIRELKEWGEIAQRTLELNNNQINDSAAIGLAEVLPNINIHTLNLGYNQISDLGAIKLADALCNSHIYILNLSSNKIGDSGAIKLADALCNSHIHILNLSSNKISDSGAVKLVEALPDSQIHTLDLSSNKIGDSGAVKLAKALTKSKLHTLNLGNNQIDVEGAIKLAEVLPNLQIHTLNLSSNKIRDLGAIKLAEVLPNSQIHTLNLGLSKVGDSGVIKLAEALPGSQIHTLNLWYNKIGNSGAIKLAEALPKSQIHTLDLSSNKIGALGITKLAEVLPNSQIHTLDLSLNKLGALGAIKLAEVLPDSQIHTLDLSSNKLGVLGAIELAKALPTTHIHTLDLNSNKLGDEGAIKLAEVLPKSQIHTLDLSVNRIGDKGMLKLSDVLPKTQLSTLYLSGNPISDECMLKLSDVLPETQLYALYLNGNKIGRLGVEALARGLADNQFQTIYLRWNKTDIELKELQKNKYFQIKLTKDFSN